MIYGAQLTVINRISAIVAVLYRMNALVAQLVEQRFCKPKVTGSNPVGGTIEGEDQ